MPLSFHVGVDVSRESNLRRRARTRRVALQAFQNADCRAEFVALRSSTDSATVERESANSKHDSRCEKRHLWT